VDALLRAIGLSGLNIYQLAGAGAIVAVAILTFLITLSLKKRINPFKRAHKFFDRKNYEKALLALELELRKNPDNRQALFMKANVALQMEQFDNAAKDYFRLIDLKKPGDGIETFKVKEKLLLPLYKQERLLELHRLCKEILREERHNAEAHYYLALLYIGQMYYNEAVKILEVLVRNRPRMHQAILAHALALIQVRKLDRAIGLIQRSVQLNDTPVYKLAFAAAHYMNGNYTGSLEILRSIPQREEVFASGKQYSYALRLRGFCNYRLGSYDKAINLFRLNYNYLKSFNKNRRKVEHIKTGIYNEYGAVKPDNQPDSEKEKSEDDSNFEDYYRLKEVAIEEGKIERISATTQRILDIEGFSRETEAEMDLGFAMLKADALDDAFQFFKKMRSEHPEVLGLKRLIHLVGEALKTAKDRSAQRVEQRSTEKIVKGKERGYKLWEYIEEWENNSIRPYQLLITFDLTSKRQLSPLVMFGRGKKSP
jgi:tetratricopeptide (TPR) repeat protein